MKTEQEKEELLRKWLEGDLSESELSIFEKTKEFKDYKVILDATNEISLPKMDEEAGFANIQQKISTKKSTSVSTSKIIPLRKWILAIASIAILAFAFLSIFPVSNKIVAEVGQFVAHGLPDGSEVNLNANSKLSYKDNFKENRVLQLDGEAFFKVTKGESFEVKTDEGTVSVLGTSFNIFARQKIFIVSCKTGKVKVASKNQAYILNKGDRIKIEDGNTLGIESVDTARIANWVQGESYFYNASLEEVALSLSSVYHTKVNITTNYQDRRFTGSFVHNDLKKALKMVFSPMQITYTVDDLGNVDLSE
jgi:ferric-dicitrate binding protein FerR (iron transport regulator)